MTWLEDVKSALESEDFYVPPQTWKPNQVFGLAKDLDNRWQVHVRGFRTETSEWLDSEIEPKWIFMAHLNDEYRTSGCVHLKQILDRRGVQYVVSADCYYSPPKVPTQLTDWRPLLGLGILLVGFAGLLFMAGSKQS